MSDEKDVGVEHKKKQVEIEDNLRLLELTRGYRILMFKEDHFLARLFKIDSIRIYDKSILALSRYGDEMFTRTRNRLMKDGEFLTYQEQMGYLKERGLWSEEREKELMDLRKRASEITEKRSEKMSDLDNADSEKVTEKLRKEIEEIGQYWVDVYKQYSELVNINYLYFSDTIEMQAETAQRKAWIVSCVTKNEGDDKYDPNKRLWKDIEELDSNMRKEDMTSLIQECVLYWDINYGGESFFAESPEELTSDSDGESQKN
jgi:hypothetical protein